MKDLTVVPVQNRRQLRQFARFGERLYRGSQYYVPELESDVLESFTPSRNSAYEFCQAQAYLAYMDGRIVGRVAAIINEKANAAWNNRTVRFGWLDFIDDERVSAMLINTVMEWGRERGMDRLEGPFGFTDFDREGMLVDGFNEKATTVTNYNYEYYLRHIAKLGLEPTATWLEWHIPYNDVPERIHRLSQAVLKRYDLHLAPTDRSIRKMARMYVSQYLQLMNEAYAPLYGYSAISDRQVVSIAAKFGRFLDYRLFCLVHDKDNNPVAVGVSIGSLADALIKSRGRLFPFGWWHLLKALKWKHSETLELLSIAIKPEYQNKGLNAILIDTVLANAVKMKFENCESNPELDTNQKMLNHWDLFDGPQVTKRRQVFAKDI